MISVENRRYLLLGAVGLTMLFSRDSIHVVVGCLVGSISGPDERGHLGIPQIYSKVSIKITLFQYDSTNLMVESGDLFPRFPILELGLTTLGLFCLLGAAPSELRSDNVYAEELLDKPEIAESALATLFSPTLSVYFHSSPQLLATDVLFIGKSGVIGRSGASSTVGKVPVPLLDRPLQLILVSTACLLSSSKTSIEQARDDLNSEILSISITLLCVGSNKWKTSGVRNGYWHASRAVKRIPTARLQSKC